MKHFQVICLKCGSEDVGIVPVEFRDMLGLDTQEIEMECKNCGNYEAEDEREERYERKELMY
jgi:hypothetical protein